MFLSELYIENFRIFGDNEHALVLPLRPGLTALVGENDTGKTAIIDALRLALGTRDQEFFRINDADFHQPPDSTAPRTEIRIRCKFDGLARADIAAFIEYLTYERGWGTSLDNQITVLTHRINGHKLALNVSGRGPAEDK
jgi:putative ATP-dependent endonuclease of the OLD family